MKLGFEFLRRECTFRQQVRNVVDDRISMAALGADEVTLDKLEGRALVANGASQDF
jgi:hypothetical protein